MGIDTETNKAPPEGTITPALAGTPSVAMMENSHAIKWPLDFLLAWPEVTRRLPSAKFHIFNQPMDQIRWWNSLMTRNGSVYRAYVSNHQLPTHELLQVFHGANFLLSPVRFGDFNRLCLEALAAGCKVISFAGNPYSHFWVTEGDQRKQAEEIYQILAGNVVEMVPEVKPVSNLESAKHMKALYERIG
jgi:glycosyltransferase involved in cell wall biosynthesis